MHYNIFFSRDNLHDHTCATTAVPASNVAAIIGGVVAVAVVVAVTVVVILITVLVANHHRAKLSIQRDTSRSAQNT